MRKSSWYRVLIAFLCVFVLLEIKFSVYFFFVYRVTFWIKIYLSFFYEMSRIFNHILIYFYGYVSYTFFMSLLKFRRECTRYELWPCGCFGRKLFVWGSGRLLGAPSNCIWLYKNCIWDWGWTKNCLRKHQWF